MLLYLPLAAPRRSAAEFIDSDSEATSNISTSSAGAPETAEAETEAAAEAATEAEVEAVVEEALRVAEVEEATDEAPAT